MSMNFTRARDIANMVRASRWISLLIAGILISTGYFSDKGYAYVCTVSPYVYALEKYMDTGTLQTEARDDAVDSVYSALPSFVTLELGDTQYVNKGVNTIVREINAAKGRGEKFGDRPSCDVYIYVPGDIWHHAKVNDIEEGATLLRKAVHMLYGIEKQMPNAEHKVTFYSPKMITHDRFGYTKTEQFVGLDYELDPALFDNNEETVAKIMHTLYFLSSVIVHGKYYDGDPQLKEMYKQFSKIKEYLQKRKMKSLERSVEYLVTAAADYVASRETYIMADTGRVRGQIAEDVRLIEADEMYRSYQDDGYVLPGHYSPERKLDEPIWTDSLGPCSALVVIDAKKDIHKMLHCCSEMDLTSLGKEFASFDMTKAEIYIYEGMMSSLKEDMFEALMKQLKVPEERIRVVRQADVLRARGVRIEDVDATIEKHRVGYTRSENPKHKSTALLSVNGKIYLPGNEITKFIGASSDGLEDERNVPGAEDGVYYKSA
jgi:hypothetical protein